MFGVTTPCVTTAREPLEERGYEVLVFHATGTGGQAMEALVERRATSRACSTSRRPSCATSSSAASCRRARERLRPRAAARFRRWSRWARSTWSTSAHATPCRRSSGRAPLRPQPDGHADAHDAGGVRRARPRDRATSSRAPRADARCSSRCGGSRRSTSTGGRSTIPRPTRRCSTRCASTSRRHVELTSSTLDINDPAFAIAMAESSTRY